MNDGKDVESLSFVLVKSFDLACKDRVDVDGNTQFRLEDIGKSSFIVLLDGSEGLSELGIVRHGQQVGQEFRVEQPLITAKGMGDECSQLGIALQYPSDCQL